ncbi:MAG TPA: hypothetical protein ENI49_06510 [Thermoplasmatales archaeon]|nr:hypothetical protein [Thermoplasmatales archaeon]
MPKASVNGTIMLDGKTVNVTGVGYHEHAWNITLPMWEYGWYWGKIVSKSFTLFWGQMMQSPIKIQQRVAVLSFNNCSYAQINPEKIEFKTMNYVMDHHRLIPTEFLIRINDSANSTYINVSMKAIAIHHIGGKINHYWRYHVLVNGQITRGSLTETINNETQIMELVRFPSLVPIW